MLLCQHRTHTRTHAYFTSASLLRPSSSFLRWRCCISLNSVVGCPYTVPVPWVHVTGMILRYDTCPYCTFHFAHTVRRVKMIASLITYVISRHTCDIILFPQQNRYYSIVAEIVLCVRRTVLYSSSRLKQV